MEAVQIVEVPATQIILTEEETPVIIDGVNTDTVTLVLDDAVVIGGIIGGGRFTFTPPSAQSTWVVPHNLNRRPAVTVLDSNNMEVFAEVQHLSLDVLSITFAFPFIGIAELT